MDKRGGEHQDFPSKIFCLTVPKNLVGEPFCVSQNFGQRKSLWIRGRGEGGSIKIFRRLFLSHRAEKFVKKPFSLSLISGIEKC